MEYVVTDLQRIYVSEQATDCMYEITEHSGWYMNI